MGAGRRSVCWHRLDDVAQDRLVWRAKMDAMIEWETKDGGSQCQSHRMTIVPSTATLQVIRWRTEITTQEMRCWRGPQCQAPAQRYNGACRGGRYAGWLYRAPSRWTFCTCLSPWNGKQVSDWRDAQTVQCKPASTIIKVWESMESDCYTARMVPYCANGNIWQ